MFGFGGILGNLAPSVPTPTPGGLDIDLNALGPPPIMYAPGRVPVSPTGPSATGSQIETGPATLPRNAVDLKAKIAQSGGALYVWTADASKSPELQIVKANPGIFKAEAVPSDPGTYKITLASGMFAGISEYAPYIVIGVGGIVLLTVLKRR